MTSSGNDKPKKSKKKGRTAHEGKKGQGKGVPRPDAQRQASSPIEPSPDRQEAVEETRESQDEQRGPGPDRQARAGRGTDRRAPGKSSPNPAPGRSEPPKDPDARRGQDKRSGEA